jgi:hypothetical protein
MGSEKTTRAHRNGGTDNIGLLASGSAGAWEVAVDQTTSGPERWFIHIEGPSASCSFEISSPEIVFQAAEYLKARHAPRRRHGGASCRSSSLLMGKRPKAPAILVRDDEYPDRFFLMVGPETALARLTIAGKDVNNLAEALHQAGQDVKDDR